MDTIKDVLQDPNARLTQHFSLWIGTVTAELEVVSFDLHESFNEAYVLDLTVTSIEQAIDGGACVGRRATFTIEEQADVPSLRNIMEPVIEPARLVHGVVTQWERVKTSRDEATYKLRIEPRVALLDRVHDSGVFQNMTLEELITELMVDHKLFDWFDVEFKLEGAQEKFEQTVMYEETVWQFISRHCRRAGIFYYFKHARHEDRPRRDTIVFGNNPRAYVRALEVPLMPYSGLLGNWREAVLSISPVRKLVPALIELWERNYRRPGDPLGVEVFVAREDRSVFGSIHRSTAHQPRPGASA